MSTSNEACTSDGTSFINQKDRNMLINKLRSSLSKGECIELIDGENLDFKGEIA